MQPSIRLLRMAAVSGALLPTQTLARAQSVPNPSEPVQGASPPETPRADDDARPAEVPPTSETAPPNERPATATAPPPDAAPQAVSAEDEAAIAAALSDDAAASGGTPAPRADSGAASGSSQDGSFSFNPDLSFILDVAAAYFSDDDPLQAGDHDPTRTGFNLQQLELAVGAAVDPYFRFDSNIVLTLDAIEIEEAYGTTLDLPAGLQARLGQFLTPFGRLNPTHPHAWDFVDQPFALGRIFGGEGNRGLGLELSWLTPLPWYVEVVGSVIGAGGEGTTRSFNGDSDAPVDGLDDFLYVSALKQFFPLSDDWSLAWGNSMALGPNATGADNRTDVFGTDVYVKFRPISHESFTILSLQTEWMYRRRQVPGDLLTDWSGYAQLYYRFAQRWATAARYEYGSPARSHDGPVAPDPLDPEWTGSRHRVSANATFYPSEFSRFRLQGSGDVPTWRDEPIWAVFLAAELVTGAHGAHRF